MIKKLITSPIKKLITSPIGHIPNAIRRYITTFDRTANTSIGLNTAGEVINDFELEVLFAPVAFGANNDVMGGNDFSLRVRADGFMLLLLPRTDIASNPRFFGLGSQAVAGKINKMAVTRSGNDFSATLNESVSDSANFTDVDADIDISVVGTAGVSGNTFFDGEILNTKLWAGGDRNTGTLLRDLPLDGIASTTTVDALGNTITPSNLITQIPFCIQKPKTVGLMVLAMNWSTHTDEMLFDLGH